MSECTYGILSTLKTKCTKPAQRFFITENFGTGIGLYPRCLEHSKETKKWTMMIEIAPEDFPVYEVMCG